MNDFRNSNPLADSAGVPWQGRSFEPNEFANDDGSAPEMLLRALEEFRSNLCGPEKVIDALREARLLVPLVATIGEAELGAFDKTVDKSADLSIVTVRSPDEQDALVVFSSVAAMRVWNESARPVPTDAVRVALAAASQMATRIVLDPGSPTEFVIRRPAIAKIAQSLPWISPDRDSKVLEVIQSSVSNQPEVLGVELSSGDPTARLLGPELQIAIRIIQGLDSSAVKVLVEKVSQSWSTSDHFASAVDSVAIKLVS